MSTIASESGLKELLKNHPNVEVIVGAIDDKLNEKGKIYPGLGDAGDRQFATQKFIPSSKKRSRISE